MVKCLECEAGLMLPKDPMAGEIISCPDCGASFELYNKNESLEIRPAQVEGEDWGE